MVTGEGGQWRELRGAIKGTVMIRPGAQGEPRGPAGQRLLAGCRNRPRGAGRRLRSHHGGVKLTQMLGAVDLPERMNGGLGAQQSCFKTHPCPPVLTRSGLLCLEQVRGKGWIQSQVSGGKPSSHHTCESLSNWTQNLAHLLFRIHAFKTHGDCPHLAGPEGGWRVTTRPVSPATVFPAATQET